MMPVIRISDSTFKDLQTLAEPLVDTPSTVINRLITAEMDRRGHSLNKVEPLDHLDERIFDATKAPGLTHTKVLAASVDGQELENPKWVSLLLSTLVAVRSRGFEREKLVTRLNIPASVERRERHGFKYYPEIEISVQGQSAQDAWREIQRLAAVHAIPVSVRFQWRDKQGAEFPNQIGIMKVGKT